MRRTAAALTLALVVAIGSGCVPSPVPSASASFAPTPTASAPGTPTARPTASPTPRSATPAPSTAATGCVATVLASMSEPQRIGQLFMIGLTDDRLTEAEIGAIATDHFGSMVFTKKTGEGVAGVRAVADAVQAQASVAATDGVRFFVAANQEGGLIQSLAGSGFDVIPSAVQQGTLSVASLRTKAARWGAQLVAAGVNLDLAPVSDVVPTGTETRNAPIGQLQREYGHDPATVASHVAAFVAGMRAAGVATSAKHFPGLGRVVGNTDVTSAVKDTVTTRDDPYLGPFAAAVDAGAPFVMVSLATYERIDPDHLAVFSSAVIRGILRDDLGFRGVVISDSLGATAVKAIAPATRAIDFLDAGGDMIIANRLADAIPMAAGLAALASTDAAFRVRIDAAAAHVLIAKEAAGLLPCRG